MSNVMIKDLAASRELDGAKMAARRGGMRSWAAEMGAAGSLGAIANVNVAVNQSIVQLQDVEVNTLNNVGVIGAGFGPLKLNVSPKQQAALAARL